MRAATLRPSTRPSGVLSRLAHAVGKGLTRIVLFDSYRPELYYMRGRGPRWHAKHDSASTSFTSYPPKD